MKENCIQFLFFDIILMTIAYKKERGKKMKVSMIGSGAIDADEMNAATLIDGHILIEVPNGIIKYLRQLNHDISQIDTVFITHFHGDHFFDVPFYLFTLYFQKRKRKVKIIGPIGLKEKVKALFELGFPDQFEKIMKAVPVEWVELAPDQKYQDKTIQVEAKEMAHSISPALGYLITVGDKTLGYSGDTSLVPNVLYLVEHSDVTILDMSLKRTGNKDHMGFFDVRKIKEEYPEKLVIATHMRTEARNRATIEHVRNLYIPSKMFEILI